MRYEYDNTRSNFYDEDEDDDNYCHACNGCGEGQYDGTTCSSCKGSGMTNNRDKYKYE